MKQDNRKVCKTKYCRRTATVGMYCKRCANRNWRSKNMVRASYITLKANAKRRGKVFELTFEEFSCFCVKTNYIIGKGKSRDGYSIDRINEEAGYTVDNIQVLRNSDNVKKYLRYKQGINYKPYDFKFERSFNQSTDANGCPY